MDSACLLLQYPITDSINSGLTILHWRHTLGEVAVDGEGRQRRAAPVGQTSSGQSVFQSQTMIV